MILSRTNDRNISSFSEHFIKLKFESFYNELLFSGELVEKAASNPKDFPSSFVGSWTVETGGDQDQASEKIL